MSRIDTNDRKYAAQEGAKEEGENRKSRRFSRLFGNNSKTKGNYFKNFFRKSSSSKIESAGERRKSISMVRRIFRTLDGIKNIKTSDSELKRLNSDMVAEVKNCDQDILSAILKSRQDLNAAVNNFFTHEESISVNGGSVAKDVKWLVALLTAVKKTEKYGTYSGTLPDEMAEAESAAYNTVMAELVAKNKDFLESILIAQRKLRSVQPGMSIKQLKLQLKSIYKLPKHFPDLLKHAGTLFPITVLLTYLQMLLLKLTDKTKLTLLYPSKGLKHLAFLSVPGVYDLNQILYNQVICSISDSTRALSEAISTPELRDCTPKLNDLLSTK